MQPEIEMNQNNQQNRTINLLELVAVIVKWRWTIIRNTCVVIVLVAIIAMVLPQKWRADTTLMPPQEQNKSALEGVLSEVVLPGLPLPTSSSSSEIMVDILRSRSVGQRVLSGEFTFKNKTAPLFKLLKYPSIKVGLLKIKRHVRFVYSTNGIITISAEMPSPQLAADVANAYVDALDKVNQVKSVSRAKNSRLYIESQLKETEQKLGDVTKRLAAFQQEHKAVSLEAQMTAAIEQAGILKGQIIAKEVELGVMLKTKKAGNPLVEHTQMEIDELNNRYKELQFGNGKVTNAESEFYVPFADVPEIGLQLAELTREAKVQETVWQLLNQQFYQAKIKEAQDTPTIQVLDAAVAPIKRSFPKRKMLVIIFTLVSFILSLLWAFVKEYMADLNNKPDDKKRIDYIGSEFKTDMRNFKNKFSRNKG